MLLALTSDTEVGDLNMEWLFGTRTGVLVLIVCAVVLFLVAAAILEHRGRKTYYNHPSDDEMQLDESESGWSDFDDDNV